MDYVELFQTQTKEQVSQLIKDELANRALETLGDIQKEYVSEVSDSTLKSYKEKALASRYKAAADIKFVKTAYSQNNYIDRKDLISLKDKSEKIIDRRGKGISSANNKLYENLTEESLAEMSDEDFDAIVEDYEQLDELSKTTLASYVKKASRDAKFSGYKAGYSDADSVAHTKGSMEKKFAAGSAAAAEDDDKAHKRLKGIDKAMTKIVEAVDKGVEVEYKSQELAANVASKEANMASKEANKLGGSDRHEKAATLHSTAAREHDLLDNFKSKHKIYDLVNTSGMRSFDHIQTSRNHSNIAADIKKLK